MFDNRESSRFPFLHRQNPVCQTSVNMERQETIHFEGNQAKAPVDFKSWINRKSESFKLWLNAKSVFYSRIAEFPVSRKLVIRINLVTLCLLAAVIAVEQQPFVAVTAGLCAGWIVYRIQKGDKTSF